jgi:hypothetical protein
MLGPGRRRPLQELPRDDHQLDLVGPLKARDYVHRGRRSVTWSGNLEGNEAVDFNLRLPIAPALTEIDGVIQAGASWRPPSRPPPPASLTS